MIPSVTGAPTPAITPVLTGSSKPPISPFANPTGNAIAANLGPLPPPTNPPEALARASVMLSQKWTQEISRFASLSGLELGGGLRFAQRDERRVMSALNNGADPERLTAATNRLLGDWQTRGLQTMRDLRHGLFRNAEHSVRDFNAGLTRDGVTSPEVHGAVRDVVTLLRQIDRGEIPMGPPGLPGRGLPHALQYAMAKLTQAALTDGKAHPEHMQALFTATSGIQTALKRLQLGLSVEDAMMQGMQQDLARLGIPPVPPYPPPMPGPHLDAAP